MVKKREIVDRSAEIPKERLLTVFPTERIEDYVALSLALVIVIVVLMVH